jgi:hypothetical protein
VDTRHPDQPAIIAGIRATHAARNLLGAIGMQHIVRRATFAALMTSAVPVVAEEQVTEQEKQEKERESGIEVLQTTSGTTGLSRSLDPVWALIADSNVSSLDVSQPSASLGLEVATPFTLARIALRKNVSENTLTGAPGARDFGRAVLRPGLANFSLGLQVERRFRSYVRCRVNCREAASSDDAVVTAKWGWGGFVGLEVADLDVKVRDAGDQAVANGHIVPIALTIGLSGRVEGIPPTQLKSAGGGLSISGSLGPSLRIISGDVSDGGRALALSTPRRVVAGGELAVAIQLGNVILDARLTALSNFDKPIPGLTGAQLQAGLTFLLPWEVVGGADKHADAKAKKAAAEKAAAEKAAAEKAAAEKAAAEKAKADAEQAAVAPGPATTPPTTKPATTPPAATP